MRNYLQEYYNSGDEAESIICDASDEIADLRSANAELKQQLAVYEANEARFIAADKLMQQQLAESQAREALQIEALESVNRLVKYRYTGSREAMSELREATFDVHEALALPHDDTAIKEYRDSVIGEFVGKFKRHVGGDGEFWLHELEYFFQNTKAP